MAFHMAARSLNAIPFGYVTTALRGFSPFSLLCWLPLATGFRGQTRLTR